MRRIASALSVALAIIPLCAVAEQDSGDVRVSVVLNTDGSRTVYENNAANHKTVATTTGKDGKMRETIRYDLDENGRFARAEILGPKEQFRFFAEYKYDANNHLIEETHLAKDRSLIGKIVFRYDAAGHQVGYVAYDGAGKVLGQTVVPSATPGKHK
jgi:YD repeat-containing protein